MKPILILDRATGQMANCLIVFANAIAYSMEYGGRVINIPFDPYASHFTHLKNTLLCRYPKGFKLPIPEEIWRKAMIRGKVDYVIRKFYPKVRGILDRMGYSLSTHDAEWVERDLITTLSHASSPQKAPLHLLTGWLFECPDLVAKHRSAIVDFLKPTREIERAVENLLAPLLGEKKLVIGVHIRRGDYDKWMHGKYLYPVKQYQVWMDLLRRELAPEPLHFLVSSNVYSELDSLHAEDVTFGSTNAAVDLFSLSRCAMIVGPPSTFSLFAAWWGGKKLLHVRSATASVTTTQFSHRQHLQFEYQH